MPESNQCNGREDLEYKPEYVCESTGITDLDLGVLASARNLENMKGAYGTNLNRYGGSPEQVDRYFNAHMLECEPCREQYKGLEDVLKILKLLKKERGIDAFEQD